MDLKDTAQTIWQTNKSLKKFIFFKHVTHSNFPKIVNVMSMLIRWIQSRVPWLIGLDRSSSFVRGRKLEPCNHSPICPNACQWIHKVKLTQDHGDKSNMYRINAFKDGPPIRSTITFEIIYFHPYTIIQKREIPIVIFKL